jgi:thioester reductase-like protein
MYIIYTSGSTGQPKGVAMSHAAALVLVAWFQQEILLQPKLCRTLQFISICFDPSVYELFGTLTGASTLILAPPQLNSYALHSLVVKYFITILTFVPTTLSAFLQSTMEQLSESHIPLTTTICGGEALQRNHVNCFRIWLPLTNLYNCYGPTEACVITTKFNCTAVDNGINSSNYVPIGRPISYRTCTLASVVDELQIAGIGLAEGYVHNPSKTALAFVPNTSRCARQSAKQSRAYLSGDSCSFQADGNMQYLGRTDNQVKVRGVRIELEEIESILSEHPAISSCVVLLNQGELRAYVVSTSTRLTSRHCREFMRNKAAHYLIPNSFMFLSELPLTSNGKINKKALLDLPHEVSQESATGEHKYNEVHKVLLDIWQQLLGTSDINIDDNFFEIGGHSLLALQYVLLLREHLSIDISVMDVFLSPTIRSLCDFLCSHERTEINWDQEVAQTSILFPPHIQINQWQNFNISQCSSILLTGATGFVGIHLLAELLSATSATVFCVVRAKSEQEALQKLITAFAKYRLWDDAYQSRIIPMLGNLALPQLGLSDEAWAQLGNNIEAIYHNGAWVNHLMNYQTLKTVNVNSTVELLKLSITRNTIPIPFFYISTFMGNLTHKVPPFNSGYLETKWVSEQILQATRAKGFPVCIFQPGFISWHSATGAPNESDWLTTLFMAVLETSSYTDLQISLNMCPVDYVCKAIVGLSCAKFGCFTEHLPIINVKQSITFLDIISMIAKHTPLSSVSYNRWNELLYSSSGIFASRAKIIVPNILQQVLTFTDEQLLATAASLWQALKIDLPNFDYSIVNNLLRYLSAEFPQLVRTEN